MKYYGQWFGGTSYAIPQADEFERFDSMRHALYVFESRLNDRRFPLVETAGPEDGGPEMLLWKGEPAEGDQFPCDTTHNYPDYRIFCGPKGGINYEAM